jgi:tRNA G26 N,N-dimethylase Trm1
VVGVVTPFASLSRYTAAPVGFELIDIDPFGTAVRVADTVAVPPDGTVTEVE